MRLIDADSITEKIMNVFEEALRIALKSGTYDLEGVMLKIKCYLDNQPTAYDVDKVVKELEKESELIRPVGWAYPQEVIATRCVIETIKAGGIDD